MPRRPPTRFKSRTELNKKRVYATSSIMLALLYAVIRSSSAAWTWGYMRDEAGEFRLFVRLEPGQRLFMRRYGYLYVVPHAAFRSIQHVLIYSTRAPVRPVKVIRVSAEAVIWHFNENGNRFVREYPPPSPAPEPRFSYRRVKPRW